MIPQPCNPQSGTSQRGFSYIEVLVATVLIAVSLVPALDALQTSILSATVHESSAAAHYNLVSTMEAVMAEPFDALAAAASNPATPSPYSEAPGTPERRLVYLAPYDGDNADGDNDAFTDPDDGLLWVRVAIEGTPQALESLVNR